MKILHAIPSLEIGGAEKIVANLSSALAENGHKVSLLLFKPSTKDCYQVSDQVQIKTVTSFLNFKYNIVSLIKVLLYLKKEKFDVVHTHLTVNNTIIRLLALIAGVRIIIGHEHGGFLSRNSMARLLLKWLEKHISYNLYISEHDLNYFTKYDKVSALHKNIIVHNPLLIKGRLYNFKTRERVKCVGMVGRINECKGHVWALKAVSTYLKEQGCKIVIVGDGDENIKKEIRKIAVESGLDVDITGYTQEVEQYLETFDILLHPSLSEGFGMAIIEAMAFGVPVIASKVGGIPNIIEHECNGLLFESMDAAGLLDQMQTLFNNPLLRERIGKNGHDFVLKKFSFEKYVATIENMYNQSYCNNNN